MLRIASRASLHVVGTHDYDTGHAFLEKGNRHIGGGSGEKEEGLETSVRVSLCKLNGARARARARLSGTDR